MRIYKLFLILALTATLSACSPGGSKGPSADASCIGGESAKDNASSTSTTSDSAQTTADKVDAALKNCKIITTIVTRLKSEVIGSDGFGVPGSSGGSSSSGSNSSECSSLAADSSEGNLGAKGIFEAFATSSEFQGAIAAAFTLYVIIYGIALASGMAQASIGEAVIKMAKLAFVAALATSWTFFYQTIGTFFIEGTDEIISYFLQNFGSFYQNGNQVTEASQAASSGPNDNIFSTLDIFIARVFSYQTYAFVSALMTAGPYAPVYGAFVALSMWWVFQAILKVVSVYVFSLFAKALLFAVAPIFLTFLLFKQTQQLFEAWLKQLVSFSLQPIFIMAFIGLFDQLLHPFFDEFATYKLCWLKENGTTEKYSWRFTQANGSTLQGNNPGVNSAPPIGLQTVLMFGFFAWLFKSALDMVDGIVGQITQSSSNLAQIQAFQDFAKQESGLAGAQKIAKKQT